MSFELGQILVTPGAADSASPLLLQRCLARHRSGDWGCVDWQDAEANTAAVGLRARLLSAYAIDESKPCAGYGENCLWIITESDRSSTTILLPSEY